MEADDLDDLIADSLAGVQTALDGDKKVAPSQPASASVGNGAGQAVRELQEGPAKVADDAIPSEQFFATLTKTFEIESFQESMAEALKDIDEKDFAPSSSSKGTAITSAASSGADVDQFLQNFMSNFQNAVGNDEGFANQMSNMLSSMLTKDVMIEPLQQISDTLETWLQHEDQTNLQAADRDRYESQSKLYKHIVSLYKSVDSDTVPDDIQQEVQRLLGEVHLLGEPPAEVMQQIAPKDAGAGDESFEDFVKQMGLDKNLGTEEQDLLKKLTEDPEELTKVMQDMAGQLGGGNEEACKQQ